MKSFRVEVWYGANKTDLGLTAGNPAHAMVIAKRVYPSGRVVAAREIK